MEAYSITITPMKWPKNQQLKLKLYLEQPVLRGDTLGSLHGLILQYLPQWGSELRAAKNEDVKKMVSITTDDDIGDVIQRVAPPRQGFGVRSAVLKGSYNNIRIYLDHCDETLPPELNFIAVELHRQTAVEGRQPSEWARGFFEALVSSLPVRYGRANLNAEFDAKNLISDAEGLRAVGVKLDVSLPGLYWLNYFGEPYVKLIGEDRLLSAPAYEVKRVGGGVLIALDASPLNWQLAPYKDREEEMIDHLGRGFFFSKDEPGRRLTAPDFRAR